MINIQPEFIKWFHSRPNWQQEAADRITKNGSLSSIDIEELAELSKTDEGQKKTSFHKFVGLGASSSCDSKLLLKSISEVEGIDSLSPRKPLQLGVDNITVVYGNNGSGKSGYTRILKKVCGKSHAVELKSNVFEKPPEKQCCKIEYELAGKNMNIIWSANDKSISDLCNIDIFDATSSNLYLLNEKEASYTPAVLSLFDKLIKACDSVRDLLKLELQKLPSKLPAIPLEYSGTKAAKSYNSLRASQTESSLSYILVWSDEEDQSLSNLNERLKTEDPKKQAEKKRTIAVEGAKAVQDLSTLSGVGSETWRALWEAARKYSNSEAYKEIEFPNISNDPRCVLCHQKLDTTACKRFQNFEEYITGKLSSDAITAETDYNKRIEDLPSIPKVDAIQTLLQAAGLESEAWLPRLTALWEKVDTIIEKIRKDHEFSKFGIDEKKYSWLEELEKLADRLESQAKQLDQDAKSFDREKALEEKKELLAKKMEF